MGALVAQVFPIAWYCVLLANSKQGFLLEVSCIIYGITEDGIRKLELWSVQCVWIRAQRAVELQCVQCVWIRAQRAVERTVSTVCMDQGAASCGAYSEYRVYGSGRCEVWSVQRVTWKVILSVSSVHLQYVCGEQTENTY